MPAGHAHIGDRASGRRCTIGRIPAQCFGMPPTGGYLDRPAVEGGLLPLVLSLIWVELGQDVGTFSAVGAVDVLAPAEC